MPFPLLCFLLRWRVLLVSGLLPTLRLPSGGGGRGTWQTEEQQLPRDASFSAYIDICNYRAAKTAFHSQRLLQRRLFSQMQTRPNTCLSVCTPPVITSLLWNSGSYGAVDQSPSFSRTNSYTRWRNVYVQLPIPCAKRGRWGKPVIKCESGNFRLGMPRGCRELSRLYLGTEYIGLTPGSAQSSSNFQYLASTIAQSRTCLPALLS